MRFVFDPRTAAQAANWLLAKHGGRLTRGQLLKLLYLSDRKSLIETGFPITGDYMVSMNQGPVLSITYDLIKGSSGRPEADSIWQSRVVTEDRVWVRSKRIRGEDYDRLSLRSRRILDEIDERFGGMAWRDLSAYTHQLPEWEYPAGSMRPIAPETILAAAGLDASRVAEIAREAEEDRRMHELFHVA